MSAKPAILAALQQNGFVGNVPRTVERNSMYYSLEAVEGHVMRLWIGKIYARHGMTSCVLRGDGIWVSADTPPTLVAQAFQEAAVQAGFQGLEMRSSDLSGAARGLAPPTAAAYRANTDDQLIAPAGVGEHIRAHVPFLDWLRFQAPARWTLPRCT